MERKLDLVVNKNRKLEEKLEELESIILVNKEVTTKLSQELDRLDQYHRQSNIVLKNVKLPENEKDEDVKALVLKSLKDELNMDENVIADIDKFHRIGYIKKNGDKKTQNIIVRFKSYSSRYEWLKNKKRSKTIKLAPNLTKKRGKMLYDATKILDDNTISAIDFVFANIHGDLQVRLAEPLDNTYVFPFNSIEDLDDLINKEVLQNRVFSQ